jgi:hypothetical protein
VRDFHPCFPRPTDWLKCEKELFENSVIQQSLVSFEARLVEMYSHIQIC